MTRILTPDQVAEMLGCTADTVREKTPHIIPGAKFGRDWVYSEAMVVRAVERMSTVVLIDSLNGPLPKAVSGQITRCEPPSLKP